MTEAFHLKYVKSLMAPSVGAMQQILRVCEDFAREFIVQFNTAKSHHSIQLGLTQSHSWTFAKWLYNHGVR